MQPSKEIVRESLTKIAEEHGMTLGEVAGIALDLLGKELSDEPKDKYFTVPELADTWRCSERAVYDKLRNGKIKGFKAGKSWLVTDANRKAYENKTRKRGK